MYVCIYIYYQIPQSEVMKVYILRDQKLMTWIVCMPF